MNDVYFKASLQNTLNPEVGTFDNEGNKEGTFTLEDGEYYLTNNTDTSYRVYYPTKNINSVGFTIEFDINYNSRSGFNWCLLFNDGDNSAYYNGFGVDGETLQFIGQTISPYNIVKSPSTWLHVKCIFDYYHDQNDVRIYIDNIKVNSFTVDNNYGIKYIDILGYSGGYTPNVKIKNIIIYNSSKHYLDTTGLTSLWSKIKSLFATKTELSSKANTSDLSTVATSGDFNDLINKPDIRVNSDNSLYVERDTNGRFFKFTHTGWSTSGSDAWGGMYFKMSDNHDVFGFAARQTMSRFEKFTIGNNGYLRGYDTSGNRTVTLVINGGTYNEPDTQNITVDGLFINAGDQKPYSANMYTIGTSDMPYKAIYAGTFEGNLVGNITGNVTGNASTATTATTATKLATARTIALSGGVTGTATSFDGSGNITIPVTALSPSAIRAQWYAAYPDGPEAHNAMWGGRDITDAFNNGTVSANIANGTFKDIFLGDYITKQVTIPQVLADDGTTVIFAGGTYTVNWVVADCDYWISSVMKTHHVAIVPQTPIFNARMNPTNTTEGGYAGSEMYKKIIPACSTGIVNAFGSDHILTFKDGITNNVDTSHASSGLPQYAGTPSWFGEWVDVQCNLMSEKMVYGAPICAAGAMDNTMAVCQMSAFRLSKKLISYSRGRWWLRDVVSSSLFADVYVRVTGISAYTDNASLTNVGVRPFALLV